MSCKNLKQKEWRKWNDMVAGQYDSLDKTRRYVYAEEVNVYHAVDSTLGRIITDCL